MAVTVVVPHAVFMLNHMMPQFIVAVFTKSFLLGSFLQLVVNFMIFNLILPPYPLEFDLALELNLYFVLAQLFAAYAGVAFSNFLYLPPLLPLPHIKQFWLVFNKRKFWWGWGNWFKIAFLLIVVLNIVPRLIYDYGISVFNPGDYLMWGLITTGVFLIVYCITYYALRCNVGKYQPFYNKDHLQFTICVLFSIEVFMLTIFWILNQFVTTDVVDLLVAVAVLWTIVIVCGYVSGRWMYAHDKSLKRLLKCRMKGEI